MSKDDAFRAHAIAAADSHAAQGERLAAIAVLFDALVQRPTDADLHFRTGLLCLEQGQVDDALRLLHRATALNPPGLRAWEQFSHTLGMLPNIPHDLVLLKDVAHALTLQEIDPNGALNVTLKIILGRYGSATDLTVERFAADRARPLERVCQTLLVNFLVHHRAAEVQLEALLTEMRARFLEAARGTLSGPATDTAIEILSALGIHGFHAEYVFDESAQETALVAAVEATVRADLAAGRMPTLQLAALAAYRPLLSLGDAALRLAPRAIDPEIFASLIEIHIAQPLAERALRDEIRKLPIDDTISRRVQAQYEESPYPTWSMPQVSQAELEAVAAKPAEKERVLVAGAGTGRHPLRLARISPNADITALDLSLASLAYGARQARALGIHNVTFVQGDLLNVAALGETFDRISSVGVLHHMAEPGRGLAALKGVLRPGGTIELGLYTESGRQAVVAGIALREEMELKNTPEDFRRFRRAVRAVPADHPLAVLRRMGDFYAMSELRDLVFHVQEHRFTLPQIKNLLHANGLKLVRFAVSPTVMAHFRAQHPGDEANIDAWIAFDAAAPGIFGSMYMFVASS